MRFETHYTRDEARALLPKIRIWLNRLIKLRDDVGRYDNALADQRARGDDLGGETVNAGVKALAEVNSLLREFQRRDIQLKDLDRGLIDFPSIIDEKEVFLCWEQDEEDIEFWHDLDAGYVGRERISGEEAG
jgi:hypothetical protein